MFRLLFCVHRERKSGVQGPDAIGLPAAEDLVRHAVAERGHRGDLVQPANDGVVLDVERVDGLVGGAIARVLVRTVVGEAEAFVAAIALALGLAVGVSEVRQSGRWLKRFW